MIIRARKSALFFFVMFGLVFSVWGCGHTSLRAKSEKNDDPEGFVFHLETPDDGVGEQNKPQRETVEVMDDSNIRVTRVGTEGNTKKLRVMYEHRFLCGSTHLLTWIEAGPTYVSLVLDGESGRYARYVHREDSPVSKQPLLESGAVRFPIVQGDWPSWFSMEMKTCDEPSPEKSDEGEVSGATAAVAQLELLPQTTLANMALTYDKSTWTTGESFALKLADAKAHLLFEKGPHAGESANFSVMRRALNSWVEVFVFDAKTPKFGVVNLANARFYEVMHPLKARPIVREGKIEAR